jgi:hypothetical protein
MLPKICRNQKGFIRYLFLAQKVADRFSSFRYSNPKLPTSVYIEMKQMSATLLELLTHSF